MSKKGSHQIKDYFDFVVPPLEGFWWQDGVKGIDYAHKERFNFISCIRMPEFVTDEVLAWAKKKLQLKRLGFFVSQVNYFDRRKMRTNYASW
jgi:Uncharacterized conserved protein